MQLSDWLNDNLDFGGGEDFDKLAEEPRAVQPVEQPKADGIPGGEDGDGLCKTDRRAMIKWLRLMASLIPQLPEGGSLKMQNTARLMRLLARKLERQQERGAKQTENKSAASG